MTGEFRPLFTPLRVGHVTLKNRIFSTAHAEAMAEDGKPGPRLHAYHEAKARGGVALTIIGGSTSVHPSSPAAAWNMLANPSTTAALLQEREARRDALQVRLQAADRPPVGPLRVGAAEIRACLDELDALS